MAFPVNEVHLWYSDPAELRVGSAYAAAQNIIAVDELERLRRFHFDRDRLAFLATRVLVRTVLSHYEPVSPVDWRFAANEYGRPRIAGGIESQTDFNLSRTNGLIVCAVARGAELGVDVEHLRPEVTLDIADRFFSAIEAAALRTLPLKEQSRRFYDYWTLKESYVKARGLGLTIPLDRFAFILEGNRPPRIEIDPALGDSPRNWQFVQCCPTNEHVVSLCIRRSQTVEVVQRWQKLTDRSENGSA